MDDYCVEYNNFICNKNPLVMEEMNLVCRILHLFSVKFKQS